jgi:uncharacterized protein YkwD
MNRRSPLLEWLPRLPRFTLLLLFAGLLGPTASLVYGEPTDEQQYGLQLINRFRSDPVGELDRMVNYAQPGTGTTWANPAADDRSVDSALRFFGTDPAELRRQFQRLTPSPPLAWSDALGQSSSYYSQVMIDRDQQSHELDVYATPGYTLIDRVRQEGGYAFAGGGTVGENIFAFAESVEHTHAAFLVDWGTGPTGIQNPPGHRENLLNSLFREIGIAIAPESNSSTDVGPLVVTQHLAVDFAAGPFLTGAVYADHDHDQFYTPGEGIGDLQLQLVRIGSESPLRSTSLYGSGGYRLDLRGVAVGDYYVTLGDTEPIYWSQPFSINDNGINHLRDVIDPQYDIDSLARSLRLGRSWSGYDLNQDGATTDADRLYLIDEVYKTYFGDANLDGEFNSGDMIRVFQAGQYEDSVPFNSVWSTGDWDGDGEFATSDLVVAFQQGGYERGPRAAVIVPEPMGLCQKVMVAMLVWIWFCLPRRVVGDSRAYH